MLLLLEITKIQILKVIHNRSATFSLLSIVVGSHKDTNFESNSQLTPKTAIPKYGCFKSQRYKF